MTKNEFIDFCYTEFTKRGFKKRKSTYYLKGKDLLCGLYLQKSMAEAYYVEFNYFIGEYNNPKEYPTTYNSDIHRRLTVMSKDTINGKHFWDACIEYELYTKEELELYFKQAFDEYIIPPIIEGKRVILENKDYYLKAVFPSQLADVLTKLDG